MYDLNNPKKFKLFHEMDSNSSYTVVTSIHSKITHFEWE